MKLLRRLWLKVRPQYVYLERRLCTYREADALIRANSELRAADTHWVIDGGKEDTNRNFGYIYLCRRRRITE